VEQVAAYFGLLNFYPTFFDFKDSKSKQDISDKDFASLIFNPQISFICKGSTQEQLESLISDGLQQEAKGVLEFNALYKARTVLPQGDSNALILKLCMESMPKSIFSKQIDEKLLHSLVHSCV